jgi:hypothetical protein
VLTYFRTFRAASWPRLGLDENHPAIFSKDGWFQTAKAGGRGVWLAVALALCGAGCKSRAGLREAGSDEAVDPAHVALVSRTSLPPDAGAEVRHDVTLWTHARDGGVEDLASLANFEGAAGLIEAAGVPELRRTALLAMSYAAGWSHVVYLANVAVAKDADEAQLALGALAELGARVRRSEDAEDADELAAGCATLRAFAKEPGSMAARRASVLRVLRQLSCPKDS